MRDPDNEFNRIITGTLAVWAGSLVFMLALGIWIGVRLPR